MMIFLSKENIDFNMSKLFGIQFWVVFKGWICFRFLLNRIRFFPQASDPDPIHNPAYHYNGRPHHTELARNDWKIQSQRYKAEGV